MEGKRSKNFIKEFWERNSLTGDPENDKLLKNCYLVIFNLSTINEYQAHDHRPEHGDDDEHKKAFKKGLKYSKDLNYSKILVQNGLIQILMRTLLFNLDNHDDMICYQEYSTAILGNLACFESFSDHILHVISIPVLLQRLITGNETIQENIASFFGNLSSTDDRRMLIFGKNAVPSLYHVLIHSNSPCVQEAVLWALNNLATLPVIITNLYEHGCVTPILNILVLNDPATDELISYACSLLCGISCYPSLRDGISQETSVLAVFHIFLSLSERLSALDRNSLLHYTSLLTSCCHVSGILSHISWSYSVRLLAQREENIHIFEDLCQVLELNTFLTTSNDCKFSPFNDLTTVLILSAMENAARSLSNLALSDFNREPIRHTGILPVVIQLLYLNERAQLDESVSELVLKKCDGLVEACVSLLCNLSKSYTFMDTILELRGIDALIHLLLSPRPPPGIVTDSSPDDEFQHITKKDYYLMSGTREFAIEALSHLAYTDEIRVIIWNSGVVSFLLELISVNIPSFLLSSTPHLNLPELPPHSSSTVQHSIVTIANLSFCKSLSLLLLSQSNILDIMIEILARPLLPEKWKEYAALFIANMAHLQEAKEKIFQPVVIQALQSLLHQSQEVNTIVAVNKALDCFPSVVLQQSVQQISSPSLSTPLINSYLEWKLWILETFRAYL
jgi:hypothetical protein